MGRLACARAAGTVIVLLMGSMAFLSVSPVAAAPSGWGTATPVETYGQQWIWGIRAAVDSSGRAVVVWSEYDNSHSAVWATRIVDGVHWTGATPIGVPGGGEAWGLGIALDENGNAIAVWEQGDLYASHFDAVSGGWESTVRLGSGRGVRIAMSGNGNGFAVWTYEDPVALRNDVWGSQFILGSGWSTPAPIEAEDTDDAYNLGVAANSRGEAIAVWGQKNDAQERIYASRFAPGIGWQDAALVPTRDSHVLQSRVALDDDGNAIAIVTLQEDLNNTNFDIVASRFNQTSGSWGSEVTLASGLDSAGQLALGVDPKGNATAAWTQRVASQSSTVVRQFDTATESWGMPAAVAGWGYSVAVSPNGDAVTARRMDDSHFSSNHFDATTGSWGPARTITAEADRVEGLHIAIDGDGNALAVWSQWRLQGNEVVANRFVSDFGWGLPVVMRKEPRRDVFAPQVEMDAQGNAVVVWSQSDGTRRNVWSSRLRLGGGWTTAEMIETGIGDIEPWSVDLAMNSRGQAIAAWRQWDGNYWSLYANRYDALAGWDAPIPIENVEGNASAPGVSVTPSGDAIVVWTREDDGEATLVATRFDGFAGSWSPEVAIPGGTQASGGLLSVDGEGNAIVVWSSYSSDSGGFFASRFDGRTTVWGAAVTLETDRGRGYDLAIDREGNAILVSLIGDEVFAYRFDARTESWSPRTIIPTNGHIRNLHVAVDADGNAIVAMHQSGATLGGFIWASRYDSSTGSWGSAVQMAADPTGENPHVVVDAKGYATVVWDQVFAGQIMANRFNPQSRSWGEAVTIERPGGFAGGATLAIDGYGNVIAVWMQWDSERRGLFANRFVADTTAPVLSLTSPKHASTVNEPTVTVAGVTEPNATLVINGLVVSVSPDGSFSFPLGLSEGMNEIRATARDEAGNVATASVRVTYRSRIPGLEQDLGDLELDLGDATDALQAANTALASANARGLLLLALQAAFVALSALLFALYWTSRKRGPGSGGIPGRPNRSTPPETTRRAPRMRQGGSASLGSQARQIPSPPWPSRGQMAASPVRLTSKERILVHLLGFTKQGDPAEAPSELTQGGIASLAGVDLRHFSQYIHPLVLEGLVEESAARVHGALKRQKVYVLTEEGRRTALAIRDTVLSAVVNVRDPSGTHETSIADILEKVRESHSILDIVREVIETGQLDLRS